MKHYPFTITDHAVVRYLERVMGVDIDALRAEIAAKAQLGLEMEASAVKVDGFSYRIEGRHIVTVTKSNHPCVKTGCVKDKRREIEDG